MLTPAQQATLKAAILAETDPVAAGYRDAGNHDQLAIWLNADSTTDAWRTVARASDLRRAMTISKFDSLSAGKRDAWRLLLEFAPVDFTVQKDRRGVIDIWGDADGAAILTEAGLEKASRAEVYFGGTTVVQGTAPNAVSALKRNWTGDLSTPDVSYALLS